MTVTAPSMADARRAARAVAVDGVSRVLLFGSLARGEQTPDSDIDLVAIFDDLDYSTRWARKVLLQRLAADAAGRPVDVRVTDWPEWAVRTERVTTSFERAVAADAVVLWHAEPRDVHWGKEIGLPATDHDEAVASLGHAQDALARLQNNMALSVAETDALGDRDAAGYLWAAAVRLRSVCSEAQLAAENALKALIHRRGERKPGLTHNLEELLGELPATEGQELRTMFVGIEPEEVSTWRARGTYPADYPDVPLSVLVATAYRTASAATRLARYAADRLSPAGSPSQSAETPAAGDGPPPPPHAAFVTGGVRRLADRIDRTLSGWDLDAATPTAMTGQPPQPKPGPRTDTPRR